MFLLTSPVAGLADTRYVAAMENQAVLLTDEVKFASDTLHESFDEVLKENVVDGQVNYAGIKGDQRFHDYLQFLKNANLNIYGTQKEKLAFWINAYNALAIKGILDGLSPGSFISRVSFFITTDYVVAGREISLRALEHDVLIPFADARIHFAIVCASQSCPTLRAEAYLASRLDEQLDSNTKIFINNPQKNQFDNHAGLARLSRIFDWFGDDFARHSGSVQKFIAQYINNPDTADLLRHDRFRLKYLTYDWGLNGTLVR